MKQIGVVGISSASQAPGTSHKFPSSWSSSARYQIRLRQTVLLQKRPTARRRATVWYGVVANRDAHARLVVVGEVFPTLSSNSPLLPSNLSPPSSPPRSKTLLAAEAVTTTYHTVLSPLPVHFPFYHPRASARLSSRWNQDTTTRRNTAPPFAPRLDPSPVPRITHAAGVRRTNERTIRARVHPLSRERGDERDSSAARWSCLGHRVWKLDSAPLRLVYLDVMDHVAHCRVGRDGLARLGFGWGGGMPSREPFRRGMMGVSVPLDTLRAVVSGAAAICARGLQTPRYQRTEL